MELKKIEKDNVVKIAGKGIEIYDQTIVDLFKGSEKVELQVTESYKDRAYYIIKQFEPFGILPENGLPVTFVKKQMEITAKDKTTFNGTIFCLTLERPNIRYINGKVVNFKIFSVENKDNIVWIADRNKEVYTQWVINKFQHNNQIEIQVKRAYKNNAIEIINEFQNLGIFPENGLPISFENKEVEITNEGKASKEKVLSITLTKFPEIYKYTKEI